MLFDFMGSKKSLSYCMFSILMIETIYKSLYKREGNGKISNGIGLEW